MKVNIEMEGTPQEVAECLKLIGQTGVSVKLPNPNYPLSPTVAPNTWQKPNITSGSMTVKTDKCPNEGSPCYCTGACQTTLGSVYEIRI